MFQGLLRPSWRTAYRPLGHSGAALARLRISRSKLMTLLILLSAALLEVYIHTRQYAVTPPDHDLDAPFHTSCQEPPAPGSDPPRANAALVMLARNKDLEGALHTINSVEKHFNRWFHYPVVFLNDEPWSPEFVAALNATVSGGARFEVIPKAEWTFPSWLDPAVARASIKQQGEAGILYAGLETYHHMCRFYSGKFYALEALQEYQWYWRIEPDVDFHCAITYDPFLEMERRGKMYGFTVALPEEPRTVPSLFRLMADWKESHGIKDTELWKATVAASWVPWPFRSLMAWFRLRDRHGDAWSLCHYWSNFEIANLEFFRGAAYQDLFEYLDSTAGFYFERWGDAAVHSLALAMLLDPAKVHHFEDFGYRHDWYYQCPANARGGQLPESAALGDNTPFSPELEGGIGCRCECDGRKTRNTPAYCLYKLTAPNKVRQPSMLQWATSWL